MLMTKNAKNLRCAFLAVPMKYTEACSQQKRLGLDAKIVPVSQGFSDNSAPTTNKQVEENIGDETSGRSRVGLFSVGLSYNPQFVTKRFHAADFISLQRSNVSISFSGAPRFHRDFTKVRFPGDGNN